jgi:hypothetical protein
MPRRIAESIPNAVEKRASEVAEKRALALWFERAEIADRLQYGLLHDV